MSHCKAVVPVNSQTFCLLCSGVYYMSVSVPPSLPASHVPLLLSTSCSGAATRCSRVVLGRSLASRDTNKGSQPMAALFTLRPMRPAAAAHALPRSLYKTVPSFARLAFCLQRRHPDSGELSGPRRRSSDRERRNHISTSLSAPFS